MKSWQPPVALLLTIIIALAADAQTTRRSVIYVPKTKGQPKQRTDGATRGGTGAPPPLVRVVTPEETALVATDRPTLYWTLDKPTNYHCDVVVKTLDDEPVYEQHLDGVKTAGLIAFDLSKGDKKLQPGKDYRFVVLITIEPAEPASDIESSATIRFEPPAEPVAKEAGTATEKAAAFAGGGYFVDAVAALANDESAEAKQALTGLLDQVKLRPK